jgi:hypothetical protein
MPSPYRKLRPFLRWMGTLAVLALFALWLASARWFLMWQINSSTSVVCVAGLVTWNPTPPAPPLTPGLFWSERVDSVPMYWWFQVGASGLGGPTPMPRWAFPIWFPALLIALPTALLWRSPPRTPRTCPSCNYDLSGLPAATPCPECGGKPAA